MLVLTINPLVLTGGMAVRNIMLAIHYVESRYTVHGESVI